MVLRKNEDGWRFESAVLVFELGVPVGATAFGSPVEHEPEGIEIGAAARVLAGVGHGGTHFAGVEMADHAVAAGEDTEAGNVGVVGIDVGAGVFAAGVG